MKPDSNFPNFSVLVNPSDDLARALTELPEHGTLLLNPGVYALSKALEIRRDVFVKSATGNERDVVLVRNGGTAIFVRDGAPVFEALTILSPEGDGETDDAPHFDADVYEASIFVSGGAPTFIDCRVSSAEASGFGVRGKNTSIRLSRCEIRKTGDGGLFLDGGARGTVKDCGIYDATLGCVDVEEGAFCEIRRSRLHRSSFACLSLHNGGAATLCDCEILVGSASAGYVAEKSTTRIFATKIGVSEPFDLPLFVVDSSSATFDDVQIEGPAILGAEILGESDATFVRSSIKNCAGSVLYAPEAKTSFDSCDFVQAPLETPSDDENDDLNAIEDDDFDEDEEENENDDDFEEIDEDDDFDEDDYSDDDSAEAAELKTRLLEEILGPSAPRVGHAIVPYRFGGALDLYYYPKSRFGGTFFASQELVDPQEFDGPSNRMFDAFELAIATRRPCSAELLDESSSVLKSDAIDRNRDEDFDNDDETDASETTFEGASLTFHRILTNLARYVEMDGVVVNQGDTLEFPVDFDDSKLAGRGFVFDALPLRKTGAKGAESWRRLFDYFDGIDEKQGDSRIGGARFGVLLAIQVFRDEMNWARENGSSNLIAKLKKTGVYPFSDLDRESVL